MDITKMLESFKMLYPRLSENLFFIVRIKIRGTGNTPIFAERKMFYSKKHHQLSYFISVLKVWERLWIYKQDRIFKVWRTLGQATNKSFCTQTIMDKILEHGNCSCVILTAFTKVISGRKSEH